MAKSADALRTIGELSAELGIPQHILRYWETRFAQLKPLTRAGNRRYYRPDDVALIRRIDQALNRDGYTVKGTQALLLGGAVAPTPPASTGDTTLLERLTAVRDQLQAALTL